MSIMDQYAIIKALVRAALVDGNQDVITHQVSRLVNALRKAGDPQADAFDKILHSAGETNRATPSRIRRSFVSASERMTPSTRAPMDPDSATPLATVVFPAENLGSRPVFNDDVSEVVASLTKEWEHHDRLLDAGLTPSLTALIYGPPGTGKTTLALWLAQQLQLPAVVARLDGLISSLLGTTARNLGALFEFANRYECVLVLDEFDAIAKVRDDPNEVGEIKRVVNALLQNMDARSGQGVTIGLTNHEALLDPAVWRRFEVQVPIPLPGSRERASIVANTLQSGPDLDAEGKLLAWLSDGLSGAEVKTVCQKWLKRRIVDEPSSASPADVIVQATATTAARHSNQDLRRFLDRDELLGLLANSQDANFSQTELAHLFGVSTKTVSRRVNEARVEVAHA